MRPLMVCPKDRIDIGVFDSRFGLLAIADVYSIHRDRYNDINTKTPVEYLKQRTSGICSRPDEWLK